MILIKNILLLNHHRFFSEAINFNLQTISKIKQNTNAHSRTTHDHYRANKIIILWKSIISNISIFVDKFRHFFFINSAILSIFSYGYLDRPDELYYLINTYNKVESARPGIGHIKLRRLIGRQDNAVYPRPPTAEFFHDFPTPRPDFSLIRTVDVYSAALCPVNTLTFYFFWIRRSVFALIRSFCVLTTFFLDLTILWVCVCVILSDLSVSYARRWRWKTTKMR